MIYPTTSIQINGDVIENNVGLVYLGSSFFFISREKTVLVTNNSPEENYYSIMAETLTDEKCLVSLKILY